ncbi:pentatricopeptide repeat-containing protein At2g13600 [Cryptomeria japonica]|uniref:pentatricopeptide repeat-containing protein At2g13600 n=1 Tax=Cryptomeria japonica TaxID=3369 RepID=UPI0027D9FEC1|nr:pentatricopeptide repeat-containing protein At2g13600 [Cryptomeria japonica]
MPSTALLLPTMRFQRVCSSTLSSLKCDLLDTVFQNQLINMYAKCGGLVDARQVFDEMRARDLFSWNVIIATHQRHGSLHEALTLFNRMRDSGVQADQFIFASILPVCARLGALEEGRGIHQSIIESGFLSDGIVVNALIYMYVKCGSIRKARELFDKMPLRNVVSWTAMIAGYAKFGFFQKALENFKQMQVAGVKPNSATFVTVLPACAKTGALEEGMYFHEKIIKSGFLSDDVVMNALIDMYAKCGSIQKAYELFDKMPQRNLESWNTMITAYAQKGLLCKALRLFKEMPYRDVVSWNVIIAGYARNGFVENALETFKQMQLSTVKPDSTTFASILPACAKMRYLEHGMGIHQIIVESRLLSDVVVASALIDMYAKCGSMQKAQKLFEKMPEKDLVSWNAIIAVYTLNGLVGKALEAFNQMQLAGVKSNSITFITILPACSKMGALEHGMVFHGKLIENGFLLDVPAVNALIDMYAKCASIQRACSIFEKMPKKTVVTWNTMIAGYAQNRCVEEALEIFKKMQLACVKPDAATFASILPACASIGDLEQGMVFHQRIIQSGFLSDVLVANALIDIYTKCGIIHKARDLFDKISERDVVSFNAMIAGYAMHGYGKDALKLFEFMKHSGIYPNHISFICVICACSHAGLVDEGCNYFNSMSEFYCILPTTDHYVCMVDLLGRAGYLEEALNIIIKMATKPTAVVWTCLLGACRSHKKMGLGAYTATFVFELDPKTAPPYVLLSDIYADVGSWSDIQIVRKLMKEREIKKVPACSWIQVHRIVHVFYVGDR